MGKKFSFIILLIVILACGALIYIGDNIDTTVNLDSAFEAWADVLRDIDQFGLKLTRISDKKEMELGKDFSKEILTWWKQDITKEAYVQDVGNQLTRFVSRKSIKYEFHVLKSSQINAFAIPGGQIFVFTGLLDFASSEAELAMVLAHEIAHVDLYHCVELFQYEEALKTIKMDKLGRIADIIRRIEAQGYSKYQELEADSQGIRVGMQSRYNPFAVVDFFSRLKIYFNEPETKKYTNPISETAGSIEDAMESYWASHPITQERIKRLEQIIKNNPNVTNSFYYNGTSNIKKLIPRDKQEFDNEKVLIKW